MRTFWSTKKSFCPCTFLIATDEATASFRIKSISVFLNGHLSELVNRTYNCNTLFQAYSLFNFDQNIFAKSFPNWEPFSPLHSRGIKITFYCPSMYVSSPSTISYKKGLFLSSYRWQKYKVPTPMWHCTFSPTQLQTWTGSIYTSACASSNESYPWLVLTWQLDEKGNEHKTPLMARSTPKLYSTQTKHSLQHNCRQTGSI